MALPIIWSQRVVTVAVQLMTGLTCRCVRPEVVTSTLDNSGGGRPAVTALAMIVTVLIGFVFDISRGGNGWPYDLIGAVGGLAYVVTVGYFRTRQ